MKADEVPEKIYLPIDDSLKTYARKDSNEEIGYTRTDAFIEKACKWLKKEVVEDYKGVLWENLIEDFRNYMKGE